MGRPRGELACALLKAANAGPGTATELGERALVGRVALAYTVTRLVKRGDLIVVSRRPCVGPGRPAAVLALPAAGATGDPAATLCAAMGAWGRPA